jgi:hypothetical protein
MLAIGLLFILLASLAVVQTQSVTVSPVQTDLSSLFETKTGQMTLQAPPYCGRFDIFCFIIFILRTVFSRLAAIFGGFGGFFPSGTTITGSSGATAAVGGASTCAEGKAGKSCRQAEKKEARNARRAARR